MKNRKSTNEVFLTSSRDGMLQGINESVKSMGSGVSEMSTELSTVSQTVADIGTSLNTVDGRVEHVEGDIGILSKQLEDIMSVLKEIRERGLVTSKTPSPLPPFLGQDDSMIPPPPPPPFLIQVDSLRGRSPPADSSQIVPTIAAVSSLRASSPQKTLPAPDFLSELNRKFADNKSLKPSDIRRKSSSSAGSENAAPTSTPMYEPTPPFTSERRDTN